MNLTKQYKANQINVTHIDGTFWYFLIAIFKLILGSLLLLVTAGAITVISKDFSDEIANLIIKWQLNTGSDFLRMFLGRLRFIDEEKFRQIGIFTFIYSGIVLTEGVGLLLKKRWARYFTVIATSLFIPFEIYKIIEHFTYVKVVILIINAAIVWYLSRHLKQSS